MSDGKGLHELRTIEEKDPEPLKSNEEGLICAEGYDLNELMRATKIYINNYSNSRAYKTIILSKWFTRPTV